MLAPFFSDAILVLSWRCTFIILGIDIDDHTASPIEKELITSLCSSGAFIGAIVASLSGRMLELNSMSITSDQAVSCGIGAAFANVTYGRRYLIDLGAVPAIILACMLPFA